MTAEFKIFISPADCGVWIHPHFTQIYAPGIKFGVSNLNLKPLSEVPSTCEATVLWCYTNLFIVIIFLPSVAYDPDEWQKLDQLQNIIIIIP